MLSYDARNGVWNASKATLKHLVQPKAAIYRPLSVAPVETNRDAGAVSSNDFPTAIFGKLLHAAMMTPKTSARYSATDICATRTQRNVP